MRTQKVRFCTVIAACMAILSGGIGFAQSMMYCPPTFTGCVAAACSKWAGGCGPGASVIRVQVVSGAWHQCQAGSGSCSSNTMYTYCSTNYYSDVSCNYLVCSDVETFTGCP